MKQIPLSKGYVTTVDDIDAHLADHKWHAGVTPWGDVYAVRRGSGDKRLKMHREIMQPADDLVVDHINGDGLDNRRENLRIATHTQNMWNATSRAKGGFYSWQTGRYRSQICHAKKKLDVGFFDTQEEAKAAHAFCAYYLRGEFNTYQKPPDFDMAKLGPSMRARLAEMITAPPAPRERSEHGTDGENRRSDENV